MRATRRDSYHERSGNEHFVVVRFDDADKKDFRPFSPNGSGWIVKDPPGKLPLFRLPELIARPGERVFIVEGEKCACELATLGLLVTTSAHGAKSAHKSDWQPLAGREVVILPDNDAEGRAYAQTVRQFSLFCRRRLKLASLSFPACRQRRLCRLVGRPRCADAGRHYRGIAGDSEKRGSDFTKRKSHVRCASNHPKSRGVLNSGQQ